MSTKEEIMTEAEHGAGGGAEDRRTWLDWGTVEIDGVEVEIEDNSRAVTLGEASVWRLRLVWPDGSKLLVQTESEDGESGAATFSDDIYRRAWAEPVVVHQDTSGGIVTMRWPSGAAKEGAWRKTRLGKLLEEHMRAAGIETLEELGEILGEADEPNELGEVKHVVFDAEYIERVTWDHWHKTGPIFWHRLEEALGLDKERGFELLKTWFMTRRDEEGLAGRGADERDRGA